MEFLPITFVSDEMLAKLKVEVRRKTRSRRDQTFDKIQREIDKKKSKEKKVGTKAGKDRYTNNLQCLKQRNAEQR